jgi:hypothetical protein
VEMVDCTLYVLKIVLYASPFDECALALRDQVVQEWCQSIC